MSTPPAELPIVVVGAGAAGLMAALWAASAGQTPVVLLERTRDGGRKILISGGGRCNVLPSRLDPREFVTDSSANTLRKLLLDWPLREQREFFERTLALPLALEPETGKLFPTSNRARDVRDRLVDRAREAGADLRFDTSVVNLVPGGAEDAGGRWTIHLDGGGTVEACRVILATGGLSVPNTGSDGTGLRILSRLDHLIHRLYPALTPLLADPPHHRELAGVSLEAVVEAPGARGRSRSRGGFLFTHRGYSGPAVLDLSHLATLSRLDGSPRTLLARWTGETPEWWEERLEGGGGARIRSVLRESLPQRLADRLLLEAGVDPETPLARLRRTDRRHLAALLGAYPLPWTGDEGYRKAEVTGGGVALSEVHPRTLESRRHPGLHLCGELLDAFGPIGGYNFAWAWATGRRAGLGAAEMSRPP